MKNPWTRQRLEEEFIGREESLTLEFKSSAALLNDKVESFVNDLTQHIGAFLNSEGGLLIIGVEEAQRLDKNRAEQAVGISPGVPRSRMPPSRLANMLCDRISPASTALIRVHPVRVGEQEDGELLLAFVVEVKPGVTAYQSADKKYYGRRSFSSNALEDKEIRLRMLADERPRASATITAEASPSAGWETLKQRWDKYRDDAAAFEALPLVPIPEDITPEDFQRRFKWMPLPPMRQKDGRFVVSVQLQNVGIVTIRRCALESLIEGAFPPGVRPHHKGLGPIREVRFDGEGQIPLYPDRREHLVTWEFEFDRGAVVHSDSPWKLNVTIFLDGGLAVRESFDLLAAFQTEYEAYENRLRELEGAVAPP
jgi:hypothetical protein